jgi:hypothetical protein
VNTRAQQTLVRVVKVDRTGAVSMQGDQVVLDRAAPLRPDGMTRQLPHEVDHFMVRSTPEYQEARHVRLATNTGC